MRSAGFQGVRPAFLHATFCDDRRPFFCAKVGQAGGAPSNRVGLCGGHRAGMPYQAGVGRAWYWCLRGREGAAAGLRARSSRPSDATELQEFSFRSSAAPILWEILRPDYCCRAEVTGARMERHLAAIFVADVVGYSGLHPNGGRSTSFPESVERQSAWPVCGEK